MGEIADMMISGDLCEMCGVALDDAGYGIPRYCSNECAKDRGFDGNQLDGAGTYSKQPKPQPENVISIKITYNGKKVYYATDSDNRFDNAVIIAQYLDKYLTQALNIVPRFRHPKIRTAIKKIGGSDERNNT